MTGLEIALGAVGQEATRIRTHAEDYNAALDPLRARGDGVSTFGDDGLFGIFTSIYAECRAVSMAALDGLSTVMADTGDGLDTVVRNTRDGEATNTEHVQQLGRTWL
ncbi:hypothetical protein SAMN05444920_111246 [Nonomuraea solani]|uniref:Excreted virulence factor EspC, type VII ESX diderm n=1 Tax=Nonomuraea solani TaxID=1144553 RepID=A0A1H6EK51_9ACTN|nr:hypothetical protein [Nonomuraea solani]SEG98230.1 hypothetical protein SAMN05444920_111246 [Nonomuraea solani]